MKAKVAYMDGSVVEFEGTPEEMRALLGTPNWYVNVPITAPKPYEPVLVPYVPSPNTMPFTITCQHEYESPWNSIQPPPCKKCGLAAAPATWIVSTSSQCKTQ